MWKVEIVEGYATDLKLKLDELAASGYEIRFVNPNGVNRWTICAWKAA